MKGQSDNRKRLASLLAEVAVHEGSHQTLVEGVGVSPHSKPVPRAPVVYQPDDRHRRPGRQAGYLGEKLYIYDPYNYLVLSVPLPVECESEAAPRSPCSFWR